MTVDMSQFFQVFFEEAGEHLANMENLLLSLDLEAPSLEDLNAIFRAAHSIKGGSGTFGFTDMTAVTHVLETLLDRLRKEELALRADMVDAFLAAGDVLKAQLEHHQGGPEADPEGIRAVCATLDALAAVDAVAPEPEPADSAPHPTRTLEVEFALSPELAADAAAVTNLVDGLCEAVACTVNLRPDAEQPRFQASITTTLPDSDLLDILSFYANPDRISLRAASPAGPAATEAYGLFEETPAEDPGYGLFASDEDGYGLFEPAPDAPAAASDDTFGLFDDAPGRPEFSPTAPVPPGEAPAAIEGDGYGLFIDAPAGMGLFPDAPGSRQVAARAAERRGCVASAVCVPWTEYAYSAFHVRRGKAVSAVMYPKVFFPTHIGVTVFSAGGSGIFRRLIDPGKKVDFESVVLPGVTIGEYALVGAGAIVTHSVPDHGLVVGNPARLVGYVCRCGRQLAPVGRDETKEQFRCDACNEVYRLPPLASAQISISLKSATGEHR